MPTCTGIACVPTDIAPADRAGHWALVRRLFDELAQDREALPDGYAFRFASDALVS